MPIFRLAHVKRKCKALRSRSEDSDKSEETEFFRSLKVPDKSGNYGKAPDESPMNRDRLYAPITD